MHGRKGGCGEPAGGGGGVSDRVCPLLCKGRTWTTCASVCVLGLSTALHRGKRRMWRKVGALMGLFFSVYEQREDVEKLGVCVCAEPSLRGV